MIPVYICDDQPEICELIAQMIEKQLYIMGLDMGPVTKSTSIKGFFDNYLQDSATAVYFLDVDLGNGENGFQLAAKIRELDPFGYIVFITSHGDLAYETFRYRLQVLDYIEKGNLLDMAQRVEQCLTTIQRQLSIANGKGLPMYTVKLFGIVRHIPINEILFFSAEGSSHRIFLHTHNERLEFFGSLTAVEKELGDQFLRCHRGYLVNRNAITSVDILTNTIYMTDGWKCPISRNAKKYL